MSGKNYIPTNDNDLIDWSQKLLQIVYDPTKYERWGIIKPDDELNDLFSDFSLKLAACKLNDRRRVDVVAKNVSKTKLVKGLRNFVQGHLSRNVKITEEDRSLMGLPQRNATSANVPPPVTPPAGILAYPARGLMEMRDIRPAADKPDARAGYGVRIYYGIMGVPSETNRFRIAERPKTGNDLPHSVFTRRKRHLFDFAGENGREVFFCMRYENSKGQPGPWGDIISAHIP